jgi:hypothetical protein
MFYKRYKAISLPKTVVSVKAKLLDIHTRIEIFLMQRVFLQKIMVFSNIQLPYIVSLKQNIFLFINLHYMSAFNPLSSHFQILKLGFLFFGWGAVFAQDPQLFQNMWYLQELTVDDVTYAAPNDEEVSEIPANFISTSSGEGFNTSICNYASAGDVLYDNTSLSFPQGLSITLIDCNLLENFQFEMHYFQEFFFENDTNPFQYEITGSNNSKILTLTSQDGDVAVYGNQILSLQTNRQNDISIAPNPFNNDLQVLTTVPINNIMVHDTLGQLVYSKKIENVATAVSLNLAHLKKGIYFAVVIDNNGNNTVKRLVKE